MFDADSIVIGSGSGGMTAALALAQAGDRVIVLEQHEVPGGWCHSFTTNGYHFSPGVHYIGRLEAGDATAQIYEGLGVADDLKFFELNPDAFERCQIGTHKFNYCRGVDQLSERFQQNFGKEARELGKFFELLNNAYNQIPLITKVDTFLDMITVPYRTRHLGKYGMFSLKWMLERRFKDPTLRALLAVQGGDHGLPPSLTPFGLHCGVMGHYFNGAYYPAGGGMSLPLAIRKSLKKHGGEIRLKSRVKKILLENRKTVGVELADGTSLRAKRVFSNADPHQTYVQMVGREHLSRGLLKKLDKTRYSVPAISFFFAVDIDPRKLGMDSGNVWYFRDHDFESMYKRALSPQLFERDEFEGLFLSAVSLRDPTQYNGRHHTLEAVTFVGYETFKAFENSTPETRPPEYLKLKEKITAMMIRTVEKAVPGLSKHIVFSELGTPVTSRHYVNGTEGACYGTEKTLSQMGPFAFRNRSEIEGLYLCGASTSAHGVSGAAFSGLHAAAAALGCKSHDLLKATGQKMRVYSAEDASTWSDEIKKRVAKSSSATSHYQSAY